MIRYLYDIICTIRDMSGPGGKQTIDIPANYDTVNMDWTKEVSKDVAWENAAQFLRCYVDRAFGSLYDRHVKKFGGGDVMVVAKMGLADSY
ncbi:predicted protein [Lichtheimia corymbifera JMRC:FSU:9682]|uniref:Uncharacterized protein n=1 Tax=Lichtheimia corymbifera JMRC:FSU:9682 TaxID=1263082 RepID=A0A068RLX0_9FUNG|nr:predicted protein [Lichtheimia corymbifera JMRC:FSU:9682]